jgi:uncharacterized RDD family membrane protein YckC
MLEPREMEQDDLLAGEFENEARQLYLASPNDRVTNFAVDFVFVISVLSYPLGFVWAYGIIWIFGEEDYLKIGYSIGELDFAAFVIRYLIYVVNYIIYYILCERLFKGKTLGKLLTRTSAVRTDGLPLSWKDAAVRTLCRIIPFEQFSAWSGGLWHDDWSGTMVVKGK